jgi:Transposase DDE domain
MPATGSEAQTTYTCLDGRRRYGRRFATVEPVFANLRHNKRLDQFTLRGRRKVDTQWKLYCLVHNIEKLMNYGTIGGGT